MKKYNLLLFIMIYIVFNVFLPHQLQANDKLPLVPYPQELEKKWGNFKFSDTKVYLDLAVNDTASLETAVKQLKDQFTTVTNREKGDQEIILGIPSDDKEFKKLCREENIELSNKIGNEGYILKVNRDKVIIAANTTSGLFYGVQTLRQLVRGAEDKISAMVIKDWPELKYRILQDDISRGPIPTMDFLKAQVRRAAELKLNGLSYYTEHVVATESHGDFAPAGAALSIEEIEELSGYARKYHIKLIGNFQSFGHFEKILAYPQYRHLGEFNRMLSPVVPESYDLLADIYSEMAPAFSSKLFNVNCDETWDLGRGRTKDIVDSLGISRVYANHLNKIYKELKKHDKKMMMWSDIALEHRKALDLIPKEVVMLAWVYDPLDSYEQYLKPLKESGFEVMVCPGILNSNRLMPELDVARDNIVSFVNEGIERDVKGMLLTIWDDGGMALFSRDWYGVGWAAESSWSGKNGKSDNFNTRFNKAVYQDKTGNYTSSIFKLLELADLQPTEEMNDKILKRQFIPDLRQNLRINLTDWDKVQKICGQTDSLLEKSRTQRYSGDLDYLDFTADQYELLAESRFTMVSAAEKYRQALEKQKNDIFKTREQLTEARSEIGEIKAEWIENKNEFATLWLRENNVYWLDHVLIHYQERVDKLENIQNKLLEAIDDLDKGHYLPPPGEVHLDITSAEGKYFQGWLICGPFPNPGGAYGTDKDYLEVMGGQANAEPFAGETITLPDGEEYSWHKYSSPIFGKVNLKKYFNETEMVLAYATCRIKSPVDQTVTASLGSNDGVQVFINGEKVYENLVKRNLGLDEDKFELPLKKGNNYMTLKIFQGKGGWGFSFRLPEENVEMHKYKYKLK